MSDDTVIGTIRIATYINPQSSNNCIKQKAAQTNGILKL